jgi:hypothetical protein
VDEIIAEYFETDISLFLNLVKQYCFSIKHSKKIKTLAGLEPAISESTCLPTEPQPLTPTEPMNFEMNIMDEKEVSHYRYLKYLLKNQCYIVSPYPHTYLPNKILLKNETFHNVIYSIFSVLF